MADKLEALAKAMLAAWRATNPNAPMWANPEDWYGLMDTLAEAALRFLGCVNSKGEVMVPAAGAIGKAREALDAAERVAEHEDRCQQCEDGFECDRGEALRGTAMDKRTTALRALRGETG